MVVNFKNEKSYCNFNHKVMRMQEIAPNPMFSALNTVKSALKIKLKIKRDAKRREYVIKNLPETLHLKTNKLDYYFRSLL